MQQSKMAHPAICHLHGAKPRSALHSTTSSRNMSARPVIFAVAPVECDSSRCASEQQVGEQQASSKQAEGSRDTRARPTIFGVAAL